MLMEKNIDDKLHEVIACHDTEEENLGRPLPDLVLFEIKFWLRRWKLYDGVYASVVNNNPRAVICNM